MPATVTLPPPAEPALPADQERSLRELVLMLGNGVGFRLALATFSDLKLRANLIQRLTDLLKLRGVILSQLEFTAGDPKASLLRDLKEHLSKIQLSSDHRQAVTVIGLENLIALYRVAGGPPTEGTGILEEANLHRDTFAKACPMPLLIWLTPADTTAFAQSATDLWHWRSATFDFTSDSGKPEGMIENFIECNHSPEAPLSLERLRGRSALLNRQLEELQTSPQAGTPRALTQRANLLGELGNVYQDLAEYDEARRCLEERLSLAEQIKDEPLLASALNDLARLQFTTGQFANAESLMRRALTIDEQSFGPEHPIIALRLNNLAVLLQATNRFGEAEALMRRALAIDEKALEPEHPNVAAHLNNLAQLLQATNRLGEAEPLMRRALVIIEQNFGPEHPKVATALNNLARLLGATSRLGEAEPLMRRALTIDEQSFGPEHPNVANRLNNLASLLQATNRRGEAEPLMRRALAIDEQNFDPEHPKIAQSLNNLAQLLKATNRLAEAVPLMERSLSILQKFKKTTGYQHPNWPTAIGNYKAMLAAMNLSQPEIEAKLHGLNE
jgi:tetratricopeptide (TPR) repeat protein